MSLMQRMGEQGEQPAHIQIDHDERHYVRPRF